MKSLISAALVIALLAISNHAEEMRPVTLVSSSPASNHLQQQATHHQVQVQGQSPSQNQNQIQIQGQHGNPEIHFKSAGQSRPHPHPHPHPNPHHPKHPHHHKGPHPMSVGRQGRAGISDLFRGVFGGRSHPHPHPNPHTHPNQHQHQHQHQQRGPAPVGYPQHASLPPKHYGDKVAASSSSNSVLHHTFPQNFNGGGDIRNVRNAQHSQQSIMSHRHPHSIQYGHGHTMPGYGPQGPRHPMANGGSPMPMPMPMLMPNSFKPPSPAQQQTTQNIMEGVSGIEEGPPPPQTPQVFHSYSEPQLTHHHYHSYQNPTEGSIQGQGSTQNVHSSGSMQESTPPGPSFNDFQQQLQGPQGGFDLGPSDPSSANSFKLSTSTTGPGPRGSGSGNSKVQTSKPNPHKWNGPTSFTEFGNFGSGAPSSSDFGNMEIQSEPQKSSQSSSTSQRSPTVSVSMSTSTSSSASPGDFSFGGPEDPEPTEQYEELTRLVRREPYMHIDGDGQYYSSNPQGHGHGSSQSNEGGSGYFPSGGGPSNFGYSGDSNGPSDQGQGPIMKSHPLRSTVSLGESSFGQEESSNQENFMFRPVSSSYRVPGASDNSAVYGKPMMVSASNANANPNSYSKYGSKIQTHPHYAMSSHGSGASTASSSVVPMRAFKPRQNGRPSQPDPLPFKSSPRLPANFDDYNSQAQQQMQQQQQMQHLLPMSSFQSQRLKPQVKKQTKLPAEETNNGMEQSNPKLKFKSSSPLRSMKSASYQRPSVLEPDSVSYRYSNNPNNPNFQNMNSNTIAYTSPIEYQYLQHSQPQPEKHPQSPAYVASSNYYPISQQTFTSHIYSPYQSFPYSNKEESEQVQSQNVVHRTHYNKNLHVGRFNNYVNSQDVMETTLAGNSGSGSGHSLVNGYGSSNSYANYNYPVNNYINYNGIDYETSPGNSNGAGGHVVSSSSTFKTARTGSGLDGGKQKQLQKGSRSNFINYKGNSYNLQPSPNNNNYS